MNADDILLKVAKLFAKHKLEAVMIGNAAAALQGAPVTTLDIDFMFRKTPQNILKLKGIAKDLSAVIMRPYYPTSDFFRISSDSTGLQLDFMSVVHGISSFPSLRSRAATINFSGLGILIASLDDIIKSKTVADRPQDRAVLPILKRTRDEFRKEKSSKKTDSKNKSEQKGAEKKKRTKST